MGVKRGLLLRISKPLSLIQRLTPLWIILSSERDTGFEYKTKYRLYLPPSVHMAYFTLPYFLHFYCNISHEPKKKQT